MGIKHDIAHARAPEPVAPTEQTETVMEHDRRFRTQYGA